MYKEILNFLKMLYRKEYIASLQEWGEGPGARVKIKAWSYGGARIKAYKHYGCTDMIDVVVREI